MGIKFDVNMAEGCDEDHQLAREVMVGIRAYFAEHGVESDTGTLTVSSVDGAVRVTGHVLNDATRTKVLEQAAKIEKAIHSRGVNAAGVVAGDPRYRR